MSYPSFRSFCDKLESSGELRRVPEAVATELQITELADREMKSPDGGKALLFEKPTINGKESSFPLAINTMGSRKRMAMALGLEQIDELADQMQFLMKAKPPRTLKEAFTLLRNGIDVIHAKPKHVRSAPCQEVVHEPGGNFSLEDLPILHCWPDDGGRFITLPTVYTKDPDTGDRNVGMYRMQVYDGWTLSLIHI